jgi:hypothetical protein
MLLLLTQLQIDTTLKRQLDSILFLDQHYREALSNMDNSVKKDSISRVYDIPVGKLEMTLWDRQNAIDSSNLVFIEAVIKKHGYPGKSLVGTPTNEAAWYVLQHSDKIAQYISVIREAGRKKELDMQKVAMMEDRYLMGQEKEQLYGTQLVYRQVINGEPQWFVWPIKDPEKVNERRKKAGFKDTVEENAQRLGATYKVVKLSEVK